MEIVDGVMQIKPFMAVTIGIVVLFLGKRVNDAVKILREYSIPEPVTFHCIARRHLTGNFSGHVSDEHAVMDFGRFGWTNIYNSGCSTIGCSACYTLYSFSSNGQNL